MKKFAFVAAIITLMAGCSSNADQQEHLELLASNRASAISSELNCNKHFYVYPLLRLQFHPSLLLKNHILCIFETAAVLAMSANPNHTVYLCSLE